jgi:hypothetical protein
MSDDTRHQLQAAYQHLKTGDQAAAVTTLRPILRADPTNADAWWLLANALDDPEKQRKALRRALDLRPDHAKAEQMLADLDAAHLPSIEDLVEGNFPFDAEYIEDDYWAKLERPQPRKSNQTLYIVLAVFGVLTVLGCGACFFLSASMATMMGEAFESSGFTMMLEDLAAYDGTGSFYGVSPNDARDRGVIEPGQTVTGSVGIVTNDRWTFTASAGEPITIELNTLDDSLDPMLYLFDSQNIVLDEDDDSGPDLNSKLELVLPYTGTYTVVVSAFDLGGTYELRLRSAANL